MFHDPVLEKASANVNRMTTRFQLLVTLIFLTAGVSAQTALLPEPPQARAKHHVASLALHAVNKDGRDAFAFNGATVAPIIRVSPGDAPRNRWRYSR